MEASSSSAPTTTKELPWEKCALGCELPEDMNIILLPCLHVMCSSDCLEKCAAETEERESEKLCKKCTRKFSSDQVQRNVKLDDFFRMKLQIQDVVLKCDACIEDDPVAFYCNQCEHNLCTLCTNLIHHPRLRDMKDHVLDKDLEKRKHIEWVYLKDRRNQCVTHMTTRANYFCFNCQKKICEDCTSDHDKSHKVVTIQGELETIRSNIASTKEAQGLAIKGISTFEEKLESLKGQEWADFVLSIDALMKKAYSRCKEMLNQRHEALLTEGQKQFELKMKGIENKITILKQANVNSTFLLDVLDAGEKLDFDDVGMMNMARTVLSQSPNRFKKGIEESNDAFEETNQRIICIINDVIISELQQLINRLGSVLVVNTPTSSITVESDARNLETNRTTLLADIILKEHMDQVAPSSPPQFNGFLGSNISSFRPVAKKIHGEKLSGRTLGTAHLMRETHVGIITSAKSLPQTQPIRIVLPRNQQESEPRNPETNRTGVTPTLNGTKNIPRDQGAPNRPSFKRAVATKSTGGRLNGRPLGMPHLNPETRVPDFDKTPSDTRVRSTTSGSLSLTQPIRTDFPLDANAKNNFTLSKPQNGSSNGNDGNETDSKVDASPTIVDPHKSKREKKRRVFTDCVSPEEFGNGGKERQKRMRFEIQNVELDDFKNVMTIDRVSPTDPLPGSSKTENRKEYLADSEISMYWHAPVDSIETFGRGSFPVQDKNDTKLNNDDDKDDYCAICLDGGDDIIVCCDFCPRGFHLGCHIPTLDKVPGDEKGDEKWRCNYEKSKEMVEKEIESLPNESGSQDKPLTEANPRQFTLACKLMMEVYKIAEIPTMKWGFPEEYLAKFSTAPYHLKFLREKLCLPKEKGLEPFSNVKEYMMAFRIMFMQAFRIYENSNQYRKPAVACFEKFQQLVKDYYPEYQDLFENVLEYYVDILFVQ